MYPYTFLTFDSDKLVAFSGVAKRARSAMDDHYIAGLRLKRLILQLLWYRYYPPLTERHPLKDILSNVLVPIALQLGRGHRSIGPRVQ
jgi:hypothetical protein